MEKSGFCNRTRKMRPSKISCELPGWLGEYCCRMIRSEFWIWNKSGLWWHEYSCLQLREKLESKRPKTKRQRLWRRSRCPWQSRLSNPSFRIQKGVTLVLKHLEMFITLLVTDVLFCRMITLELASSSFQSYFGEFLFLVLSNKFSTNRGISDLLLNNHFFEKRPKMLTKQLRS